MSSRPRRTAPWLMAWCLACALGAVVAAEPTKPTEPTRKDWTAAERAAAPFAVVGSVTITGADYQRALQVAMRKKYYHAKPPEAEVAKFRREVGDDVVATTDEADGSELDERKAATDDSAASSASSASMTPPPVPGAFLGESESTRADGPAARFSTD